METTTKMTRAEVVERVLYFLELITVSKDLTQELLDDAINRAREEFWGLVDTGIIGYWNFKRLWQLVRRGADPEFFGFEPLPKTKRERAKLVRKALN